MIFKYKAFDKNGKLIKGKIEASNKKEALLKLENLYVTAIKPVKGSSINVSLSKKVPNKELSKLFNSLGLYLKSSIPLVSAINLTKNQTKDTKIIKFLDYLQNSIKEGNSFYTSLQTQQYVKLPKYVTYTVNIGDDS